VTEHARSTKNRKSCRELVGIIFGIKGFPMRDTPVPNKKGKKFFLIEKKKKKGN
jgi:hypothetical protein